MRALLQRVRTAEVRVEGQVVGAIGPGWLVLLGIGRQDDLATAKALADKVVHLRAFPDDAGRMNRSVLEVGGEVLVVSQFTLYADLRRGRRPYFGAAAPPEMARELVDAFTQAVASYGLRVATGVFGAMMEVIMVGDGPVTLWLDSAEL
ncbi:MAG TPA: D-aminoacyl-tRNA deacylase [Chloroflexota bacterium]|nr:D-aminoacyl-tRNA deacylase [Chloroflexota bacterium]